jgi:hypothetical protein
LHLLGNDLAGRGAHIVQVAVPELDLGLMLPPSPIDQKTKDDTSAMLVAASVSGGLDDLFRDDFAVGARDLVLLELAGHALLNQMAETEGDLGDGGGRDGRLDGLVAVARQDCLALGQDLSSGGRRDTHVAGANRPTSGRDGLGWDGAPSPRDASM